MMRQKYIEERFPRYFVFGTSADGMVDVSSTTIDPVATVSAKQAEVLIEERKKAVNMIVRLALALDDVAPELLYELWYGSTRGDN